jgi:hypothetical protein
LFTIQDLLRQFDVTLSSPRANVVSQNGLAVARRLCQTHTSGNHGLKNVFPEEIPQIRSYLLRQVCSIIEHRQEYSFYLELVVKGTANSVDSSDKLGYTFKRKEFAL